MAQHGFVELEKQQGFYHNAAMGEDFRAFSGNAAYTIILHFQNYLAIVLSKSHER